RQFFESRPGGLAFHLADGLAGSVSRGRMLGGRSDRAGIEISARGRDRPDYESRYTRIGNGQPAGVFTLRHPGRGGDSQQSLRRVSDRIRSAGQIAVVHWAERVPLHPGSSEEIHNGPTGHEEPDVVT